MKGSTQAAIKANQLNEVLKRRLQFHNIFRETSLVPDMNSTLELPLASFRKIDILASYQQTGIQLLLAAVPFLKILTHASKGKIVRFQYNFSPGMIVVTGIYDQPLLCLLTHYEQSARKPKQLEGCKEGPVRRTFHNGFFTMIEAYTKENAQNLQGYLRNRKKTLGERDNSNLFKMENRKARIFSPAEEKNLYSFIVDIMLEYKAEKFTRSMQVDLNCMPRPLLPPGSLLYRPFSVITQLPVIKRFQLPYQTHQTSPTSAADVYSGYKEEDVSSDSTCLTSENVDKMQDVVQDEPLKLSAEMFFLCLEGKEE